jgi:hypothetical protein
MIATRAVQSR